MKLWNRIQNAPSSREGTPAGDLTPRDMAQRLMSLSDFQWGRYAFSREPLEGKFTPEQKDTYTLAAIACGKEWAQETASRCGSQDPKVLAERMGIRILTPDIPTGGAQVMFAQFIQPDEITVFTDCLDKAAALGDILPPRERLMDILLAHELFHAVEERNPDKIFTRTEKIELWRKPFSNKSGIVCLSEIAAMAFARELLGLSFNPYALDVLLVWPYDAVAARELYEEICDLTKDV